MRLIVILLLALWALVMSASVSTAESTPPQYALIHACGDAGTSCITMEDRWGPYEDVPTCEARLAVMWEDVKDILFTRLGPFQYRPVCGTLEQLRRVLPDAFGGAGEGPAPGPDVFEKDNKYA